MLTEEQRMKRLEDQLEDLKYWRDPDGTQERIISIAERVESFKELIDKIEAKVNHLYTLIDVEEITEDDVKELFQTLGITQAELGKRLGVSNIQAYRYANGKMESAKKREIYNKMLKMKGEAA